MLLRIDTLLLLLKKTWLTPEDTVFARISLLAALAKAAALVALCLDEDTVFARISISRSI
ncbi:MAG: hypothetical protein Q8912_05250 [Bacillota bacterium]|nr:hypothetical protein [Bacillota bacterium]